MGTSLENRQYFPCFAELPIVDEYLVSEPAACIYMQPGPPQAKAALLSRHFQLQRIPRAHACMPCMQDLHSRAATTAAARPALAWA